MALTQRDKDRLKGVHPDLITVVEETSDLVDIFVIEGLRTDQRQAELYAQGRSKPGKIVTWTMQSKHKKQADGFGHAVDIGPRPLDWNNFKAFQKIADTMFAVAKKHGVGLRWGADWDEDGKPRERGETDSPHFELDK